MLDKLRDIEQRWLEMEQRAVQPDFYNDPAAASAMLRESKRLEPIVMAYRSYLRAEETCRDAQEMLSGAQDAEMKEFCREEFERGKREMETLRDELRILLLPRDPNDEKNVIVEIRGGVGGEESALFAHSLFRMYSMYAESKRWKLELLNYSETELGGVREADFMIVGDGAYSRLKYESGVHRVQRVPETESGGRVHTSTATVAVLPEVDETQVELRQEDIEMQVFRSSGAGGQHINKTSSAVRLIHKPARRREVRCRTANAVCRCSPRSSMRSSSPAWRERSPRSAEVRSVRVCGTNASAPTISRRGGSRITASD